MIYCPEILMRNILAHIHYMPDSWKGNAHKQNIRDEFSLLFQYKVVSLGQIYLFLIVYLLYVNVRYFNILFSCII